MPSLGVSGLVSGINSSQIIDALVEVDRGSIRLMENQKTKLTARLEAVRSLNTRLLSAQIDINNLKRAPTYSGRAAISGDASVLTATATSEAVPGTYSFEVVGLAKAHQVATAPQVTSGGNAGTGTVTLQVGSGVIKEIAIGSGNTGLQNIAKAINDAKAGVVASVVNDGTGYRMILQSQSTGADNTIAISAVDDNGGDGADLSDVFTGMTTIQGAANAQLQLGSGGAAVVVDYKTNTITDFIPGVTLDLKKLSTGPVTVNVTADTANAETAITTFVDSFNSAYSYLKDNSSYDPVSKEGGILIGETGLRNAMGSLRSALTGFDPNLPASANTLASVGITLDRTSGALSVDMTALRAHLAADPDAVAKLFTNSGESSDPGVKFAFLGAKTVAGTYDVVVTQAATQAVATTTGDIVTDGGGLVTITGANKTLALTINGKALNANLAEGIYTRTQLAEQLQTAINSQADSGSTVAVGLNGNAIDLRSKQFGSNQVMQVTGGSAATIFNFLGSSAQGLNVSGTIGGVAATGLGQVLTAGEGTAAKGMGLVITAQSPLTTTLTARKGLAQRGEDALRSMTESVSGTVTQKEDSLGLSIEGVGKRIATYEVRLQQRRERYEAKFLAMEKLIASFKSQESSIQSSISGFENAARSRSSG